MFLVWYWKKIKFLDFILGFFQLYYRALGKAGKEALPY